MDHFQKYRKTLYSIIKIAYHLCMCFALAVALLVYPAYSLFFSFSVPVSLTTSVFIVSAVLTLCRALVSVDSGDSIETLIGSFLSCVIFAVAYHFKDIGGFAIKDYIFSFAVLTAAPYRIPALVKGNDPKKKSRFMTLFAILGSLFTFFSAISVYTCIFRSPLTASLVVRLCGYPMLVILPAAVNFGMKRGILSRVTFYSARLLSITVAAFVFVTSFNYHLADVSCTVLSLMLATFIFICITDILKKRS